MIRFYDITPAYAAYLHQFESKIPNIVYETWDKFVCGIVLTIDGYPYYAPISSNTAKQRTSLLITDDAGTVLSSIRFSFMFPAPPTVTQMKNFAAIRAVNSKYADLLEKEYDFCRKNEQKILQKAQKVYQIGTDPSHPLYQFCCNFKLLEEKYDLWLAQHTRK